MNRCMIEITQKDRKRNDWVRNMTKVTDVIKKYKNEVEVNKSEIRN